MENAKNRIQNKINKLQEKVDKSKQKIKRLQIENKAKERKKRTRELIQIGGLAEIAKLINIDKGAVLGLFIKGQEMLQDKETYLGLKRIGDRVLKERASRRNKKARGQG